MLTADEMLRIAREGRPEVRYAKSSKGDAIGAWVERFGRYVTVACQSITGEWVRMPHELLVNGEPIPQTWIE